MGKDTEQTKVIFRVDRRKQWRGTVDAIFPELIGTNDPNTMLCYAHIGQHSTAHKSYLLVTRAATEQEYASLKEELESIGYNLKVVKRATHADYLKRLAQMH